MKQSKTVEIVFHHTTFTFEGLRSIVKALSKMDFTVKVISVDKLDLPEVQKAIKGIDNVSASEYTDGLIHSNHYVGPTFGLLEELRQTLRGKKMIQHRNVCERCESVTVSNQRELPVDTDMEKLCEKTSADMHSTLWYSNADQILYVDTPVSSCMQC